MKKEELIINLQQISEIHEDTLVKLNVLKLKKNLTESDSVMIVNFYQAIANLKIEVLHMIDTESQKDIEYSYNMIYYVEQLRNLATYYRDIAQMGVRALYSG